MTNDFAKYYDDDLLTHATFPRRAAEPSDIISTVTFLVENQFVNGVDLQVSISALIFFFQTRPFD
jgi:hypothetical protein